jgi:hypothetical protein
MLKTKKRETCLRQISQEKEGDKDYVKKN